MSNGLFIIKQEIVRVLQLWIKVVNHNNMKHIWASLAIVLKTVLMETYLESKIK